MELPKVMRAWQYGSVSGGLENSLKLNSTAALPTPIPDQHLVKIHSVSLNPVDYKPAETSLLRRLLIPNPATPGIDFSGVIVKPAKGSKLKLGDKVFGSGPSPFAGGCLAEYAVTPASGTVLVPDGISMENASTVGVAGLSAWQSIVPFITKDGSKNIFLNGGSGGGIFGIQIAKAMGCEVTVTCSGKNVETCKELGADHVIDYTKQTDLPQAIADSCKDNKFDHIVNNVSTSGDLYWQAHKYSKPNAKFIKVGGDASLDNIWEGFKMRILPSVLGGGKRQVQGFFAKHDNSQLERIAGLIAEGKIKPIIDNKFAFEDLPQAFTRLKTGRAVGKIVITVDSTT